MRRQRCGRTAASASLKVASIFGDLRPENSEESPKQYPGPDRQGVPPEAGAPYCQRDSPPDEDTQYDYTGDVTIHACISSGSPLRRVYAEWSRGIDCLVLQWTASIRDLSTGL